MNRKEFFRELMRYLLLLVIGGGSAALIIKNRKADTVDCPPGINCQGCSKAARCNKYDISGSLKP
jgi:hypothetical protein